MGFKVLIDDCRVMYSWLLLVLIDVYSAIFSALLILLIL